jgi:hypothetical protein
MAQTPKFKVRPASRAASVRMTPGRWVAQRRTHFHHQELDGPPIARLGELHRSVRQRTEPVHALR